MKTTVSVSASGPMAKFWTKHSSPPAVIVNREASPVDLLSWCMAELTALRSIVNELTVREVDIEPNKLFEMVGHHLDPLPDVLEKAIDGLSAKGGAA
jgi:hypothetical protein